MDSDSSSSNSPQSSVPVYYRLNSEVIEKPSHFQHSDCEESLEILALLSSPEEQNSPPAEEVCVLNYGGLSPCSSSKGDGSNGSDFEGIGDEDEGFDEEFEFYDNDEVKDTSNNPNDIDINDKDLQRILLEQSGIPLSSALDDFDLGVVFDSEPTFQPSLDNSINQPSSPYHQHTPSPGVPVTSSNMATMEPDSSFVDSGSYYPTSTSFIDFEPIQSCCDTLTTMSHNTGASWFNPSPTLASVNISLDSIDLNEASRMMAMSIPNLTPTSYVSTPASPHTPMSTVSTPSDCRASRSLSPAPPSHTHNPPATPPSQAGAYYVPSPAESSRSTGSTFSNISCNSTTNLEKQAIIDMPFHKFKKVLDDNTVPEEEKERLKATRRRGKNKRAAYNCRKKKITMICGLQQEIDQMKVAKARLAQKSRSLEQEIARWKQLYTHRYNCRTSR